MSITPIHWAVFALSGAMRWRTRSTRISPPPPGRLPNPAATKSRSTVSTGSLKNSEKATNSLGLNPWTLNPGYFVRT